MPKYELKIKFKGTNQEVDSLLKEINEMSKEHAIESLREIMIEECQEARLTNPQIDYEHQLMDVNSFISSIMMASSEEECLRKMNSKEDLFDTYLINTNIINKSSKRVIQLEISALGFFIDEIAFPEEIFITLANLTPEAEFKGKISTLSTGKTSSVKATLKNGVLVSKDKLYDVDLGEYDNMKTKYNARTKEYED